MTWLNGKDDAMFLETIKESFCNKPDDINFKLEHMWCNSSHQPKWYARHGDDDLSDTSKRSCLNLNGYYSSMSQESVDAPGPFGHDRVSSMEEGPITSRSESSSTKKATLKKLYKTRLKITQTKLFEQFNKLLNHYTTNINKDTKMVYTLAFNKLTKQMKN
jgi:hypothetical protein